MSRRPDGLYELLPQFHRRRDAEAGEPLRALLAVMAEQLDLVESDIEQLYDDWFIETCAPWAVPYLGDLVGYRTLRGYEEAVARGGPGAASLAARLAPRADVAATVSSRRRKGTLPLLENIAWTVAGWPARAVEFQPLLDAYQSVRLAPRATQASTVDVRRGADLDELGTPFDGFAHGAAARRISSGRGQSRYSPPAVGLFVWRLKPYSITNAPAYCIDRARNLFTFSILGNDTPLVTKPVPEPSPTHIATADNVPAFIRRRALAERLADFYGPGKSFQIWRDGDHHPVPLTDLVVADLSGWAYRPQRKQVAVDPVLGRIAFGARSAPKRGVWVTYHYAFSDDLGGGEYPRELTRPPDASVYRVGPGQPDSKIMEAYQRWREERAGDLSKSNAIIEITDSGAYQEQIAFVLDQGDRLEVRAADGVRPVIRLLDWYSNRPDALIVEANAGSEEDQCGTRAPRLIMDGLLITGRGVHVSGPMGEFVLRHCTLVPGWTLEPECHPAQPEEPSLILECTTACVQIERSILGTILVVDDEVRTDPLRIHLADSVLDATDREFEALSAPECRHAHAILSIRRSTVLGEVHTHAISLGENSIFDGRVHVARRGIGCLRFCYVPPGSRTPRRYHCQPDLAGPAEERRVRPRFTSVRYGTPGYVQLAAHCPAEIARGAEDGSELGAFHDLFQPQREDNLLARLEEFLPAGLDAGIVYES
ncbi:hypothetical protein [Amycolatopsis sp. NPDC059657]|uniref:hypothetical protein n=1 Tax=Amycolatopsis sp. NPDC059657 TaxID=3346899 RepID=UPI00367158CA